MTPLHCAAAGGHHFICSYLLSEEVGRNAGVHVNAVDKNKCSPLHVASNNGHKAVAEVLLQHGANANAKNSAGMVRVV